MATFNARLRPRAGTRSRWRTAPETKYETTLPCFVAANDKEASLWLERRRSASKEESVICIVEGRAIVGEISDGSLHRRELDFAVTVERDDEDCVCEMDARAYKKVEAMVLREEKNKPITSLPALSSKRRRRTSLLSCFSGRLSRLPAKIAVAAHDSTAVHPTTAPEEQQPRQIILPEEVSRESFFFSALQSADLKKCEEAFSQDRELFLRCFAAELDCPKKELALKAEIVAMAPQLGLCKDFVAVRAMAVWAACCSSMREYELRSPSYAKKKSSNASNASSSCGSQSSLHYHGVLTSATSGKDNESEMSMSSDSEGQLPSCESGRDTIASELMSVPRGKEFASLQERRRNSGSDSSMAEEKSRKGTLFSPRDRSARTSGTSTLESFCSPPPGSSGEVSPPGRRPSRLPELRLARLDQRSPGSSVRGSSRGDGSTHRGATARTTRISAREVDGEPANIHLARDFIHGKPKLILLKETTTPLQTKEQSCSLVMTRAEAVVEASIRTALKDRALPSELDEEFPVFGFSCAQSAELVALACVALKAAVLGEQQVQEELFVPPDERPSESNSSINSTVEDSSVASYNGSVMSSAVYSPGKMPAVLVTLPSSSSLVNNMETKKRAFSRGSFAIDSSSKQEGGCPRRVIGVEQRAHPDSDVLEVVTRFACAVAASFASEAGDTLLATIPLKSVLTELNRRCDFIEQRETRSALSRNNEQGRRGIAERCAAERAAHANTLRRRLTNENNDEEELKTLGVFGFVANNLQGTSRATVAPLYYYYGTNDSPDLSSKQQAPAPQHASFRNYRRSSQRVVSSRAIQSEKDNNNAESVTYATATRACVRLCEHSAAWRAARDGDATCAVDLVERGFAGGAEGAVVAALALCTHLEASLEGHLGRDLQFEALGALHDWLRVATEALPVSTRLAATLARATCSETAQGGLGPTLRLVATLIDERDDSAVVECALSAVTTALLASPDAAFDLAPTLVPLHVESLRDLFAIPRSSIKTSPGSAARALAKTARAAARARTICKLHLRALLVLSACADDAEVVDAIRFCGLVPWLLETLEPPKKTPFNISEEVMVHSEAKNGRFRWFAAVIIGVDEGRQVKFDYTAEVESNVPLDRIRARKQVKPPPPVEAPPAVVEESPKLLARPVMATPRGISTPLNTPVVIATPRGIISTQRVGPDSVEEAGDDRAFGGVISARGERRRRQFRFEDAVEDAKDDDLAYSVSDTNSPPKELPVVVVPMPNDGEEKEELFSDECEDTWFMDVEPITRPVTTTERNKRQQNDKLGKLDVSLGSCNDDPGASASLSSLMTGGGGIKPPRQNSSKKVVVKKTSLSHAPSSSTVQRKKGELLLTVDEEIFELAVTLLLTACVGRSSSGGELEPAFCAAYPLTTMGKQHQQRLLSRTPFSTSCIPNLPAPSSSGEPSSERTLTARSMEARENLLSARSDMAQELERQLEVGPAGEALGFHVLRVLHEKMLNAVEPAVVERIEARLRAWAKSAYPRPRAAMHRAEGALRLLRLLRERPVGDFDVVKWETARADLLGAGRFGAAYAIDSERAVKLVHRERAESDRCVAHDFFAEVAALERLRDAHWKNSSKLLRKECCATLISDYGVQANVYAVVMERCGRGSLLGWRLGRGPVLDMTTKKVSDEEVALYVGVFARVARCVAACADADVAHLDLKCENVLLRRDPSEDPSLGCLCLCDFGESRLLGRSNAACSNNFGCSSYAPPLQKTLLRAHGTESVQPPEVLRAQPGGVGPPADVWALGCLLFELLAGFKLFDSLVASDWSQFFVTLTKNGSPLPPDESIDFLKVNLDNTTLALIFPLFQSTLQRDPYQRPSAKNIAEQATNLHTILLRRISAAKNRPSSISSGRRSSSSSSTATTNSMSPGLLRNENQSAGRRRNNQQQNNINSAPLLPSLP